MAEEDKFPNSYKDPLYASLDASNESRLGLPVGMLSAIRLAGERSNHDQVSSASARTVYQITPATRQAILDQYGIDPYLSPAMASEGAAILLRDSLKRNDGDPELAVREYHGGTDPKNWGKQNDAYWARTATAMRTTSSKAMQSDFEKFMAANPAVPASAPSSAAAPQGQQAAQTATPIAQDFANWMKGQGPSDRYHVPGEVVPADRQPVANVPLPPVQAEPGLVDKAIGTVEAGANLGTSVLSALATTTPNVVRSIGESVADGSFGTRAAADQLDANVAKGMQTFTYQPRTQSGAEQAQAVGDFVGNVLAPLAPMATELQALHAGIAPARDMVRSGAQAVLDKAATAVPDAARAVAAKVGLGSAPEAAPTAGTLGSAGAAGTDMATQRRVAAQSLPVPIELSKGQAERSLEQLRFEQETAKDPANGKTLRNFYADQNDKALRNFDTMIDQTGAEAPSLRATGVAVDKALVDAAARDKARVRVAYKSAEKEGELEAPVSLDTVVQHLNDSAPEAATAPLIDVARAKALQLGIAVKGPDGMLVAQDVPLKTAEMFRQSVNRATDFEPTNVRQATIIKGLVDEATDGMGGDLYKQARALRARFAQNYENRANVAKLLDTKRGTTDRTVALEDVFGHTMLRSSLDDVRNVRRVLQRAGPDGQQAWKELQGQTINWIKDQATQNVATDIKGNPIVSAAKLNSAIRTLDHDGKLDFVFGKQGAQQLRDLNELSKQIYTTPPGTVNTSNTASVILQALAEAGVTGSMTGLPVPVLSGLRMIATQAKNYRIQKRVQEAIGRSSAKDKATAPAAPPAKKTIH